MGCLNQLIILGAHIIAYYSYSVRFQAHAPEPQTPLAFTCVSGAPPGRLRSVAVAVEAAGEEERKGKGGGGSNSDKILRP